MTQEEKSLLLKDLCARLHYGVMISHRDLVRPLFSVSPTQHFQITLDNAIDGEHNGLVYVSLDNVADDVKPYLRPMSSMTEEERKEWYATFESVYDLVPGGDPYNEDDYDDNWHEEPGIESFDWLNAHHFDCRGLIDKGLALEAPKNMY